MKTIMKTVNMEKYKHGMFFGYKLVNTTNGKWYYGISKQTPENYTTSSKSTELLSAISKGEIERTIEIVDDSWPNLITWEHQLLTEKNAAGDTMSYNGNNGMSTVKKCLNSKLMKKVANDIINDNRVSGIEPVDVDLTDEVLPNDKTKLKPSSRFNSYKVWQVRDVFVDTEHKGDITSMIDEHYGNLDAIEESIGQKLLVVVLEDRVLPDGRKTHVRIGGNHTWYATLESQFGFNVRILYIPKHIHGVWSDLEIRMLAEYLNPIKKVKTLETSIGSAIKTCYEILNETGSFEEVTKHLSNENWSKKQKEAIKRGVKKQVDQREEAKVKPKNFLDYSTPERKQILVDTVKRIKRTPHTLVKKMSTGSIFIGDYISEAIREVRVARDEGKTINTAHIVLYHPTMKAKQKFEEKWKQSFVDWQYVLKGGLKLNLTWEVMPHLQDE